MLSFPIKDYVVNQLLLVKQHRGRDCVLNGKHIFRHPQKITLLLLLCREEKRNCYSFSFLTLSDSMSLPTLCVVLNQQQQSGTLKPSSNLSILLWCLPLTQPMYHLSKLNIFNLRILRRFWGFMILSKWASIVVVVGKWFFMEEEVNPFLTWK